MILYSILLTLWSGSGIHGLQFQALGFIKLQNLLLILVIFLLLFFTEVLNKSGRMQKTVEAIKIWLPHDKLLLSGLPALIGLLPMPGGALVSAPLVKSIDSNKKLKRPLIVAINYWYRHIWEFWWPLYPGVILAITISGLAPWIYYLIMVPFTPVAILGGYFFLLRKVEKRQSNTYKSKFSIRDITKTLGPLGILVLVSILGSLFLPKLSIPLPLTNVTAMLLGLIIALLLVLLRNPEAFLPSVKMVKSKKTVSLMLVIIGVQLFSTSLKIPLVENNTMNLVTLMRDELSNLGVPILLIMTILPLVSGFVTGVAFAFVGASFPLVFELLGTNPSFNALIATTTLCYALGYIGMILSPVHICFVVTSEYFKSQIFLTYKYLIGPVLGILGISFLLTGLYYIIF